MESTKLSPKRNSCTDDKLGVLDVRVLLKDGRQFDIEMQVAYFEYWDARILFYLSKIFTDQLKRGEPYENLKKCIHVSILDFIYFENDEECCRTICFCDEKTGKKYTDLMEIQILELKKLPQDLQNNADIINWMRFLGGKTRREFEAMAKKNQYIDEAYRELEKLSADEQAKLEYEAREKALRDYNSQMNSALRRGMQRGIEKGQKKGLEEGRKEGLKEGKSALIRTMFENGAEPELIAQLTGLSLSEIDELRTLRDNDA